MSDSPTSGEPARELASQDPHEQMLLDPRRPRLLDDRERVLAVKAGHVDIFVVGGDKRRRHLFRVEAGEIILDLHTACANVDGKLQIVAVGGPGTELTSLTRTEAATGDLLARWIAR